jgi:hypothetical protein
MASRKIRDVVVKVGEYTDRNTGETKGRFENVGALMQNDDDSGSYFIMLKRTFNPAGVPKQDDRESILLSCYVPKEQREANASAGERKQSYVEASGGRAVAADMDDEIPF